MFGFSITVTIKHQIYSLYLATGGGVGEDPGNKAALESFAALWRSTVKSLSSISLGFKPYTCEVGPNIPKRTGTINYFTLVQPPPPPHPQLHPSVTITPESANILPWQHVEVKVQIVTRKRNNIDVDKVIE